MQEILRPNPMITSASLDAMRDGFGRVFRDLRISVTDRCNFRCVYCMPKSVFNKGFKFLQHDDLLSLEEIERLAKIFVPLGLRKIRLTGGEPLLRRNLVHLIENLTKLPEIEVVLTTNGSRLTQLAQSLKNAGLNRLTVSLDALDEALFQKMTDSDFSVKTVLDGIDAAKNAGFEEIKINMVVKRGMNDSQIIPMVEHFRGSGHVLRFIEFMDVGTANNWKLDEVMPSCEVIETVDKKYPVEPINPKHFSDVAKRWRYKDGAGEIGVVSSVTQAFCSRCSRLRLSSDGVLFTCLFADNGYPLRDLLRKTDDDDVIRDEIKRIWSMREDRYSEIRTSNTYLLKRKEMHYLGG